MGVPTYKPFGSNSRPNSSDPVTASTSLATQGSAVNTAATISMTGASTGQIAVAGLFWSYSAVGVGKIQLGDAAGNIYFEQDVGQGTPQGAIVFSRPRLFPSGTTVNATLAAVAAITGKLVVDSWMNL